ncbi:Hypothetical protein P9303_29491 [Prochlorococcus marinus str. MIT 9303]|uniref:Prokaryotic-type class I peptide chain release factors domain-containing protein n=1 Tax=Prochlorococcus marinus (strain MIT 9303) TaxID=59922 RepID=A2CDW9_PROM3|nr:Hypothetical protein P9303_29491 [Prochlorococcus marinus str. MIT 9303]
MAQDLPIHKRLVIPSPELQWRFSRSSGPGGQGVNTTDSRVELVFDLAASTVLGPFQSIQAAGGAGLSPPSPQAVKSGAHAGNRVPLKRCPPSLKGNCADERTLRFI